MDESNVSLALANVDYDLHLLEVPIYSEWEIFVESLISLTDLVASADGKRNTVRRGC